MSAERMPRAQSSLLTKPLAGVTALVVRFPVATMLVSGLLAAASLYLAKTRLQFETSRANLLSPTSDYNRRWLKYAHEFGEQDDVVVVASSEDRRAILPVLDELAKRLQQESSHFRSVFHKVDPAKLKAKGLHYMDPKQLAEIEGFLGQAQPVLDGDWAALNVGGQLARFADQLTKGDPRQAMAAAEAGQAAQAQALAVLAAALGQAGPYRSPWPDMPGSAAMDQNKDGGYILANDGRVGMLMLWLVKSEKDNSFAEYADAIVALRHITGEMRSLHPNVWIGLTGMPIMENDEMQSSSVAMTQAGILSLVGVALLYIAGFGCIRHPTMALIALVVPMAWSFGFIVLAIGHLNILSSAFATIIIGLGSDFGVYHIAEYLRLRARNLSTRDALMETARSVGPGITTGALSTSLAFFVIGLSDFPGIAELGVIAGGGILLCWVAALTTLPAMIQWSDGKRPPWKAPAPLDVYGWLGPLLNRPKLLLVGYGAVTLVIALGIGQLWYDHNLLNMQAAGLESVELEERLLRQNDFSASFAVSVAKTREELLARKEQFHKLPMVDSVKEIVSYFPQDTEIKRPIIERIHARLGDLPNSVPPIPVVPPAALDGALARLEQLSALGPPTAESRSLGQLRNLLLALPEGEYYRRLSAFQQAMAQDLLGRLRTLASVANPEPPQWSDLPEGLVARFVGRHGCYAMQIYTKADIWNMDAMEKFVGEVRSIDPEVTGNPLQIYEASRQMKATYEKGALYGVLVVLVVVYLDFRSVRLSLLALLPLAASKLQLFGMMGWLGIPLNPANMIVLPLIIGVGVDNGVHLVHDFLRGRTPYRISPSTGAAIVINTLQNIVGFGGLMIATHRGLHSLGRVLTLGMACCLVSGLVMPALLRLMQGRLSGSPAGEPGRPLRFDTEAESLAHASASRPAGPVPIRRRADAPV
jgi:hopanoid biosynthesis associated RND transporter like protein HpnN